jgi:hypothetical protein
LVQGVTIPPPTIGVNHNQSNNHVAIGGKILELGLAKRRVDRKAFCLDSAALALAV